MAERRGLTQITNFPRVTGGFRAIPGVSFIPEITFIGFSGDGDDAFLVDNETENYALPAHNSGDLLLFYGGTHKGFNPSMTITTAGWTRVANLFRGQTSGVTMSQEVWFKYGDGAETIVAVKNVSGATAWLVGLIAAFRGVRTSGNGGPFDVTPLTGHTVLDQAPVDIQTPAITTITDDAWFLSGVFVPNNLGIPATSIPSGYTNRANHVADIASVQLVSKIISTAGVETPGEWGLAATNDDGVGFSAVLMPAQS